MQFISEERPSDSPFVQTIWHTRSEGTGTLLSQAASQWEMVVSKYQGQTFFTVRGPETKATPADVQWTEGEFVGIVFRLGTFMPHLPPGQVMNRNDVNLPEVSNNSFCLHGSAWEFPGYDNADTFVDRLVREGLLIRDEIVEAVLHGQPHTCSLRSVQYRFLRATGLTRNMIQQIERARLADALLKQGLAIPDVVYKAGYFDQPHMTRSLKHFLGQTPGEIMCGSQLV